MSKNMANRLKRKQIAAETLDIIKTGFYSAQSGLPVEIKDDILRCDGNTKVLDLDNWKRLFEKCNAPLKWMGRNSKYEITKEYSISSCQRLNKEGYKNITCLNFASAKNPCGGMLKGSIAQEESLGLCSALHSSLSKQQEHYALNKKDAKNGLYQDSLIFSPKCPVFRDDISYNLLHSHFNVNFISCPAVNLSIGMVPLNLAKETMKRRTKAILSVAIDEGCDALVLGAWGTGVFQNDIKDVAEYFKNCLKPDAEDENSIEEWDDAFAEMFPNQRVPKVVFAVGTDVKKQEAFKAAFALDRISVFDPC